MYHMDGKTPSGFKSSTYCGMDCTPTPATVPSKSDLIKDLAVDFVALFKAIAELINYIMPSFNKAWAIKVRSL